MKTAEERDLAHIWHPCSQMKDYETLPPIVVERGAGTRLYDVHGKEYLDVVSSWWCNLLGHCNPVINEAVKKQLYTLEHVIFANFSHMPAIELAERLCEILPDGLTKFNFSDNGSAAVECALKMAFQYAYQTGQEKRTKFMCLTDGYHGETIGALSVGAMDLYAKIYRPMLMETVRIPAPDCYRCPFHLSRDGCRAECFAYAEASFAEHAEQCCAVIVEPLLQGSAGMRIYPPVYLEKLRKLCDETGVLLIADEIATGFFRTGHMFACDAAKIRPDIMCLSKGLTGGYMPMAITVTTRKIYDAFYADYNEGKAFMHSHTYSGNPLGCAAALAVQEIFRTQPIRENALARAKYLREKLTNALADREHVGEIRSLGLINAVELVRDKRTKIGFDSHARVGYQIYRHALQNGLLLRPLGDVLYFNPPLTVTEAEIDEAVAKCVQSVEAFFVGEGKDL